MIDVAAAERAHSWVGEAVSNGATALCGNHREGGVLSPTVLTGTAPEMRVISEEVFAPICSIEQFESFEDAVSSANSTRFGLQAGVFSSDLRKVQYAVDNLEFGGVIVNDAPTFRVDNMPYGGTKDSGYGREGVRYAMEEMTDLRMVVMNP
jgi:acyl-CoA reductase-like NAD-dependent aldehyde dehydrogenase